MAEGPSELSLTTPLQFLKGVGPRRAADLAKAGLSTIEDLLTRFPLRYEDRSRLQTIVSIKPGPAVSFSGRVLSCGLRATRRPGFKVFEALVADESGAIRATWLNQPFLRDVFQRGQLVVLYGTVEPRGPGGLQITNPHYEILDEEEGEPVHTGRIVPVYERTGGVTPKVQRALIHDVLRRLPDTVPDALPDGVSRQCGLPGKRAALLAAHFPPADASLDALNQFATPAQQRLILEEAFVFQVGVLLRRREARSERKAIPIRVNDAVRASARSVLPFPLTKGQKQALREIVEDLQAARPMNRLLQGDVGAGKTIVALLAALVAMENGAQVAFMAPTEILAEQHFTTLTRLLQHSRFRVVLVTGAVKGSARRQVLDEIATGAAHLAIGTHALVQGGVRFQALGLVVIDEQHRFGVLQRATLRSKGSRPDVLVMTATPIPRTLALTLYGDLDVSSIHDRPPGRVPVKTVARSDARRDEVYALLRGQIQLGHQAYVVFPLVEESAKLDLKAATAMADTLQADVFPEYRIGLLHGRLKADIKERVMRAFVAKEIDILVSTTVIEVGVDVPNATVMVVEHAERFGLSQLHQLRGRVGRDSRQSYCCLVYQSPLSDDAKTRIRAMTETNDGFELAERDLRLRGAGDLFGTRQAGLPTFRLIDLVRDQRLLELARREADVWIESPDLSPAAIDRMLADWQARFQLVDVG